MSILYARLPAGLQPRLLARLFARLHARLHVARGWLVPVGTLTAMALVESAGRRWL